MLTNLKLRLLSYVVIMYMLLAFAWWSILLYQKNQDAYQAKIELLAMGMVAEGIYHSEEHFHHSPRYLDLTKKYHRQEWMIFGEGSVFIISLVIGMWFIHRSYRKEIELSHQRRNFLLSITHELKSPISSIRLVLETFLKRKLTPEQANRLGKNAIQDSERLNELVNNILLAARLETAYQPHFESIRLDELLDDIIDTLIEKFPKIIFSKNIQKEVSIMDGDQMGLISVVTNMVENSEKYNQSEFPQIDVELIEKNNMLELTFSDNGIGISDKEKKKVFERFYRVGNEDTRTTKGTGLGLYIVNQIIKAHNGKIQILDNQPVGTIFKLFFPTKNKI